jgi:hypothetical protein
MSNQNVPIIFSAIDATGAAFSSVRGKLQGLGEDLISVRGILGALTAAFSAHAFAEGIRAASEAADAAAKLGDRFGIATEKIVGMRLQAELSGGSQQGLSNAMRSTADLGGEGGAGQRRGHAHAGVNEHQRVRVHQAADGRKDDAGHRPAARHE